jgi:hypothetical protein
LSSIGYGDYFPITTYGKFLVSGNPWRTFTVKKRQYGLEYFNTRTN